MAPSAAAGGVESHDGDSSRGVQSSFGLLPSSRHRSNMLQENQYKHLNRPPENQVPSEAHSVVCTVNAPSKDSVASRLEELLVRRAEYTRGLMSVHNVGLDFDAMTTMGLTILRQANETAEEECEPRVESRLRARLINGIGIMSRRNRFGLRPSTDGSPGMSKDDASVLQRLALVAGDESTWKVNQDKFASVKRRQKSIPEAAPVGTEDPDAVRWARKEVSVSPLPDMQQPEGPPPEGWVSSNVGTSQSGATQQVQEQAEEQYQLGPGMGYSGGLRGRNWVSGVIKLGRNGLPLHPAGHWQYDDGGKYDGPPERYSAASIGDSGGSCSGSPVPSPSGEAADAAQRVRDAAVSPGNSSGSLQQQGVAARGSSFGSEREQWDAAVGRSGGSPGSGREADIASTALLGALADTSAASGDSKNSRSAQQMRSSGTGRLSEAEAVAHVMCTPSVVAVSPVSPVSPVPPIGARESNSSRAALLRRLAVADAPSDLSGSKGNRKSGRGPSGAGRLSKAQAGVSKQRVYARGSSSSLLNGRESPWPPDNAARAAEAAKAKATSADVRRRLAAAATAKAAATADLVAAAKAAATADLVAAAQATATAEKKAFSRGNSFGNGHGSPSCSGSARLAAKAARISNLAREAEEVRIKAAYSDISKGFDATAAAEAAAAEAAAAAAAEAAARTEGGSSGSHAMSPVDCMALWTYMTNALDGSKPSADRLKRNMSFTPQVRQCGRPSLSRNVTLREAGNEALPWDMRPASSFSCTEFELAGKREGASVRSSRNAISNIRTSISRRASVLPLLERMGQCWESEPPGCIVGNPSDLSRGASAEQGNDPPQRTRTFPVPGLPVSPRQPSGHSDPLAQARIIAPPILYRSFLCVGEGLLGDDSSASVPYGNPLRSTLPSSIGFVPRRTASPTRQRFESLQLRGQTPLHTRHAMVKLMPFSEGRMFSCDISGYAQNREMC